jgi:hypothetical protein
VCAIVHGYSDAAVALADTLGVRVPEYDQVVPAPDSHYTRDGGTIYTDATVRLLRKGEPVFFLTVEMQRRHVKGKYATLHGYHGSGVHKIDTGGHLIVLSDKPIEAAKFRREDADRRAELAFAASFHDRDDVEPMRANSELSLGARAVPAALADLGSGIPRWAREMLLELTSGDPTLANLYIRTIIEEVPDMTMLEADLTPEMLERLRELEAFRSYEAKVEARAEAKAEAKVKEAEAKVRAEVKEAEAKVRAEVKEAEAKVRAEVIAANLKDFLVSRGDKPSKRAFKTISACRDADELDSWLRRAYQGETSAQLFPEPTVPQAPTS